MMEIALKNNPTYVCLVPEKRKELTTEGGLNVIKYYKKIKFIVNRLNKKKIRTSLFINPSISNIYSLVARSTFDPNDVKDEISVTR